MQEISSDDRTRRITIDLERPDALLPYRLAATWAVPVPRGTPTRELARLPGVGPYVVARRDRGTAYVLRRRRTFQMPGIAGGNVDVIAARVVPTAAARTSEALAGTLDAVEGEPPVTRLPDIRSKYKDRYSEHPTLTLRFAEFDVTRAPFRDEDARRAVAFALDERTLTRLHDGFLTPTCNAIPQTVPGYRAPDPCPFGERAGNADLVEASELVERSSDADARVLVDGGAGPRGRALARYGAATLDKIGLRARPAGTPAERRRAQLRFAERTPAIPHPARYVELAEDPVIENRVELLEQEGLPAQSGGEWADIDAEVVAEALLGPYGVSKTGVLLSERLDGENCVRRHPVHGLDLSSLCVR